MGETGIEIRTRTLADGVAIEAVAVPSAARRVWLLLLLFGAAFVGAGLFSLSRTAPAIGKGSIVQTLVGIAFSVPFILAGSVPLIIGLWLRFGVWEVEVARGRLARVIRLGGLRWAKGARLDEIESIELRDADLSDDSGSPLDSVTLLSRRHGANQPLHLAWGTRARMAEVASLIGQALRAPEIVQDRTRSGEFEHADIAAARGLAEPLPELPTNSRIVWSETPDGLTVMLPRLGLMRSNGGLLFMALVWNLIAFGVGGTFMVLFVSQWKWTLLLPAMIGGLFILIGVWLMRMAIARGTRRGIIDVVGGALMITQQTAFGESIEQWEGTVRAIRAEPSGETINERPILHLAIEDAAGKKKGFFKERSDDELKWLAAILRNALGVGSRRG